MATDIQNDSTHEEQPVVPVEKLSEPESVSDLKTEEIIEQVVVSVETPQIHEEFILNEVDEAVIDEEIIVHSDEDNSTPEVQYIDYSGYEKPELVQLLEELVNQGSVQSIANNVENIKANFYKKHRFENDAKRKAFLETGGDIAEYKPEEDAIELQFKAVYKKFRDQKMLLNEQMEKEKLDNLKAKYQIIEEIKELVSSNEKINKTYQEFKELQNRWRNIGLVPQSEVGQLWQTYHHHVEIFYGVLKLNKEARDLDLKKNLEEKIRICERSEELLLEPLVVKAFQKLQELHNQWREVGPVPHEKQEEIWERFKQATTTINKKHQDYFDGMKQEQENNLEAKTMICEKAEEILGIIPTNPHAWEEKTNELIELQKLWKTIGAVPRKVNTRIFTRFKDSCDGFFNNKKEFFKSLKDGQNNNLQYKIELCMQVEALQESSDWRKTTDEIIGLQKKWKEIGPIPNKHSEIVWKRFRTACDHFFRRKEQFFASIDGVEKENLRLKNELIDNINNFVPSENSSENINVLKTFQNNWTEIGHVPIKSKDDVQLRFREAINKQFGNLKLDRSKMDIMQFKNKVESFKNDDRSNDRLYNEKVKVHERIKALESDLNIWENNIGFFAKSKNAESLIKDFKNKIEKAKQEIQQHKDKLKIIDSAATSK